MVKLVVPQNGQAIFPSYDQAVCYSIWSSCLSLKIVMFVSPNGQGVCLSKWSCCLTLSRDKLSFKMVKVFVSPKWTSCLFLKRVKLFVPQNGLKAVYSSKCSGYLSLKIVINENGQLVILFNVIRIRKALSDTKHNLIIRL